MWEYVFVKCLLVVDDSIQLGVSDSCRLCVLCSSHMSAMDRWNRLGAFYSMQISRVHRRFIMRHFSKLFSSGKTQLDHFYLYRN